MFNAQIKEFVKMEFRPHKFTLYSFFTVYYVIGILIVMLSFAFHHFSESIPVTFICDILAVVVCHVVAYLRITIDENEYILRKQYLIRKNQVIKIDELIKIDIKATRSNEKTVTFYCNNSSITVQFLDQKQLTDFLHYLIKIRYGKLKISLYFIDILDKEFQVVLKYYKEAFNYEIPHDFRSSPWSCFDGKIELKK